MTATKDTTSAIGPKNSVPVTPNTLGRYSTNGTLKQKSFPCKYFL